MKKEIGGQRLGSGAKLNVDLKTYNRSNHDLSYIWRNTMSAGTLVPFMTEVGLPGDTFDIDLNVDVKTHPTTGPLFGSFKVQLDVFKIPIRLYNSLLNNDKLGIGNDMAKVKFPIVEMWADNPKWANPNLDLDNCQINPSSIWSYLDIRGLGVNPNPNNAPYREFNAIPYLAYWDIYKNYYANKQENKGVVIHSDTIVNDVNVSYVEHATTGTMAEFPNTGTYIFNTGDYGTVWTTNDPGVQSVAETIEMLIEMQPGVAKWLKLANVATITRVTTDEYTFTFHRWQSVYSWRNTSGNSQQVPPKLKVFNLENLDTVREEILQKPSTSPYIINTTSLEPYSLSLKKYGNVYSKLKSQEGLAIKTYQSDLFNNWINEEWITGTNGINEITAIDTSSGSFTVDTLLLSRKVYDMLNRIAISGGTYDDWIETVYTNGKMRRITTPMYMGGLIRELGFQEVVSNSEAEGQPLGSLAGKGILTQKHKGGQVRIKIDEPSYIMGIVSLTPRVDYSQGNKWHVNLMTMNDLHKPALDEIGFQDLITDQMAWWDTIALDYQDDPVFNSMGKQPAWLNYMTNVNQVRGNFAIKDNEMYMTLNRRYEFNTGTTRPKDFTTYIDPKKYNHIFAETSLDAMNFWTQIGVNMRARRVISSKIMPNL